MSCFRIVYREKPPAAAAYLQLFETTGWNQTYRTGADELNEAISSSWYVLSAYDHNDLVGFGRVISDGVLYALTCNFNHHQCHIVFELSVFLETL
jgi:hypothetical protein